jgi:hypothetical protein
MKISGGIKLTYLGFLGLMVVILSWNYDILARRTVLALTVFAGAALYLIVFTFLQKKFRIVLPTFTALMVLVANLFDSMGNFCHFYSTLAWWDDFTHFYGTATVTGILWMILYLLNQKQSIKIGNFALGLFALSTAMLLASFYEMTEYWGDLISNSRRIGDRYDTVADLNWNFWGAVVVNLIGWLMLALKRRRK